MAAVGQLKPKLQEWEDIAAPHNGNDPIVTLSRIANAQAIVASSYISIRNCGIKRIHIEAGNTWNVIPEKVFFEGTIRTLIKKLNAR